MPVLIAPLTTPLAVSSRSSYDRYCLPFSSTTTRCWSLYSDSSSYKEKRRKEREEGMAWWEGKEEEEKNSLRTHLRQAGLLTLLHSLAAAHLASSKVEENLPAARAPLSLRRRMTRVSPLKLIEDSRRWRVAGSIRGNLSPALLRREDAGFIMPHSCRALHSAPSHMLRLFFCC